MEHHQAVSLLTGCIKRYRHYCLFILRTKQKLKPKLLAILHIFHFLQILTLIFRPEEPLGLHWNYSCLNTLWIGLSIVTRQDYLASYIGFTHSWIISYLIIWSYLATKGMIMYRVEAKEFLVTLSSDRFGANWVRKYAVNLHKYSNTVLFNFQSMSILQSLINMPAAILGNIDGSVATFIASVHILLFLIIYIEDAVFLQKLNWISYKHHEITSSNSYILLYRVLFVILNFTIYYIDFSKNSLVYSIILLFIGAYQSYLFAFKLPYGCLYRNIMKGGEGLLLLWGGFVLILTEMFGYTEQDSYFSTLLYFIPIGLLIFIYKEFIQYRYRYLINTKTFLNSTQVFHIFIALNATPLKDILNFTRREFKHLIKVAIVYEPKNTIYLLWLAYMMSLNRKYTAVKVLISILIKKKNRYLSIYIDQLRENYYVSIQSTGTERKEFEYILYISYYSKLLKADRQASNYLINLYGDLLAPHQDSRTLSKDMSYFHNSIIHTRDLYTYILSLFNKNSSIYDMYAGYLDVIEYSPEEKEKLQRLQKFNSETLRKGDMENIYFDSRSLVLIVSAETKSIGNILDVKNAAEFGFKDFELEGEHVSVIFPGGIYASYLTQIRAVCDVWNKETGLLNSEECYMVMHGGYLIPVLARNNLINLHSGKLAVILAIQHREFADIAILDEEGKSIQFYVMFI
jgi:hypothetical protein